MIHREGYRRRDILRRGWDLFRVGLAGLLIPRRSLLAEDRRDFEFGGPLRLDEIGVEVFTPHVGSFFSVAGSGPALRLIEAVEVRSSAGGRRPAFSLLFEGPSEPVLAQHTYELSHPALGRLGLFLVPTRPGRTAARYEAVFN